VPLAAISPAAAVPALALPEAPARAVILETARPEVEPIGRRHRAGEVVTFPMYAHIAVALTKLPTRPHCAARTPVC